jgi:hypothetical protein
VLLYRWFAAGGHGKPPAAGILGSSEHQQQQQLQQQEPERQAALPPPLAQPQQQERPATNASTARAQPAVAAPQAPALSSTGAAASTPHDPLHDSQSGSQKEAEQLTALSHVIQQQQQTIVKQVGH